MSRSFRKYPRITDHGRYTYQDKRNANKKVRHTKDIPDGGSFKKVFCSYDISDYNWGEWSWGELWDIIVRSEEDRKVFYEQVFHKPYTKKAKTEKELQREFWKRLSK